MHLSPHFVAARARTCTIGCSPTWLASLLAHALHTSLPRPTLRVAVPFAAGGADLRRTHLHFRALVRRFVHARSDTRSHAHTHAHAVALGRAPWASPAAARTDRLRSLSAACPLFMRSGVFIQKNAIPEGWSFIYHMNPLPKSMIAISVQQFYCPDSDPTCPTIFSLQNGGRVVSTWHFVSRYLATGNGWDYYYWGWLCLMIVIVRIESGFLHHSAGFPVEQYLCQQRRQRCRPQQRRVAGRGRPSFRSHARAAALLPAALSVDNSVTMTRDRTSANATNITSHSLPASQARRRRRSSCSRPTPPPSRHPAQTSSACERSSSPTLSSPHVATATEITP